MSIYHENNHKLDRSLSLAYQMMIAARTAPKGKGRDTLEMLIVDGEDIKLLSKQLHLMGKRTDTAFYHRDGDNLLKAEAILLIGTRIETLGLDEICQLCGFDNCKEKEKSPNTPCVFNTSDLNLAIGSAVSLAADMRVDNRIMFSVGKAAQEIQLFDKNVKIVFGIPISIQSKNPFFDR
ncbi:MAG: ferredoxin [Bacteroidales bacterium]|nr:ferredoxin [Bacteroidales bacterium]